MKLSHPFVTFLTATAITACSGTSGDSDTGSDSSIPQGEEDFVPPPSDDGSGNQPSGATDTTCQDAEDCAYWYCECADGAIVNTANCTNGFCLDAKSTCPAACEYFEHGAWSGRVGGGPTDDTTPPPTNTCGTQGSTSETCWSCVEAECCDVSAACYDNPECLNYWDCVVLCAPGDVDCTYDCDTSYPGGAFGFDELASCLENYCSLDC